MPLSVIGQTKLKLSNGSVNLRVTEVAGRGGLRYLEKWDPKMTAWVDLGKYGPFANELEEALIELMVQVHGRWGVTDFA
jgi:hypothetical protein